MKTERFEMRIDRETLEKVDEWRINQPNLPSRAEAVRRLVDAALAGSGKGTVRISDGEKLILMMLCDLNKHQKADGAIKPSFVSEMISLGHYWALDEEYGILSDQISPQVVSEVRDALGMWSLIERCYEELSEKDKERVESEAEPFGTDVKFKGFDGNDESDHLSVARFLIDDRGRYPRFKGRELNSHCPNSDAHRRMLSIFKPMLVNLEGFGLSASQIIDLLKAIQHPSYSNDSA